MEDFDASGFEVTAMLHPSTYLNKILLGGRDGTMQLWNIRTQCVEEGMNATGAEGRRRRKRYPRGKGSIPNSKGNEQFLRDNAREEGKETLSTWHET